MTADSKGRAEVTRRDRLLALHAVFPHSRTGGQPTEEIAHWLDTGNDYLSACNRVARAIADARSEALADREHLERGAELLLEKINADVEVGRDAADTSDAEWAADERARKAER